MPPTVESVLKTTFGYDSFRPLQPEVIDNVLKRRDTLAIMPTGGGKSLCYQIPALLFPGLTVVVSPLIALMKDQVEQLEELGVPALFLNSSLSPQEYQENMELVRSGKIKLLYVAPETLLTPRLFNLLASIPVDCLTIDEAHCISEWGHDFRPEYRQLVEVRKRFPKAVCLALTATATERVRLDIQKILGFETANEFIASFDRENLLLEVLLKDDPAAQTLQFLKRFRDESGIIYCFSRKQVDELAEFLSRKGFSVRPYHAGLEDDERSRNQQAFIQDDVQIIVATIAFGMGINKPNVRFVIHYDLPKSVESYYQEIGRAGRDGLPAHCLLLFSKGDMVKLKYFIDQKEEPERSVAYQHLNALVRYAESDGCRRRPLLAYFGEAYTQENCGMCDNCRAGSRTLEDITIPAQKFLSCVKRTGERFGAGYVIDVLLGSQNQKVLANGHLTLSTFGIGKELTRPQWQNIARQLVQKDLLLQDEGQYPTLSLTDQAYEVLRTKQPILGYLSRDQDELAGQKEAQGAYDQGLFDLLRSLRKELATARRVPPYVIFSDRTLVEMATFFPQSEASLLKISGVGQVKAAHFGHAFLKLIQEYCKKYKLSEKDKPGARRSNSLKTAKTESSSKHKFVAAAYNGGETITALAETQQVQKDTILAHLTRFGLEGGSLRLGADLLALSSSSPQQQKAALAAFKELGAELLKPIFEKLGGAVNYDELKILRVIFLARQNPSK